MDISHFFGVIYQAVEINSIKNQTLIEELKIWIKWVSNKADWYDPIINKKDNLFDNNII